MGTNFHTAWIDDTTRFKAADMNAPLSGLDRGITYLKNIIAAYEGALSYSGGTLTWSDTIHIYFNTAAGLAVHNSIAAGSIALTDGQFAYVTLSETNNAALTVSAASISTGSASNYLAYNVLVLAYRDTESDNLFIVNLKKSFDQEMKPTDSPTFAYLTLSGLTASLPVFSDASKKLETKTASAARTALYQTYKATETLAGQDGVTVTHNKGDTNYIVAVMPEDVSPLGAVGEISVVKAANTVVIYNTGFSGITADVEISDIS